MSDKKLGDWSIRFSESCTYASRYWMMEFRVRSESGLEHASFIDSWAEGTSTVPTTAY
ncbi:hypothetical protein [Haladaptatus sp. NG-SE-30]